VDQDRILELNDVAAYAIDVPPGETELKVTLAYPDPPGTTSASLHRINDVDLRVTSPSAALYLGNVGLEDGTESTTGGSADDLNTVENVFVTNPEAGIWTVEVEAVEVNLDAHLGTPADDVAFGLVVTGGSAVTTSGAGSLRVTPSKIACDQPLSFRVRDGNVGAASVDVAVASETETAPETVTLVETNPGSGNYTGQIPTTTTLPAVDDSLSVADGDTITVEYVDADDGAGGSNVTLQDTATTDCSAPAISNVMTVEITDTEAAISWITDEAADSSLSWGTTLPPGQIEERSGHATTHSLRLRGLAECTTYFYSVSSSDPVGNTATDDNAGAYYLFTTLTRTDGELHSCRDRARGRRADRGRPRHGCLHGIDPHRNGSRGRRRRHPAERRRRSRDQSIRGLGQRLRRIGDEHLHDHDRLRRTGDPTGDGRWDHRCRSHRLVDHLGADDGVRRVGHDAGPGSRRHERYAEVEPLRHDRQLPRLRPGLLPRRGHRSLREHRHGGGRG
jgi:hypothetical protein